MTPPRKTRIITTAWGDSYVSELLEITLPALLAPGNLPALVRVFDVEFVLVTETREFEAIRAHPVFRALERACPARLIACDDLVVSRNMYGHSLTHCLHRGFDDLGDAMCEWNLLFLNSDFILADGSYAVLAERLLAGDRLVFAPSYCTVSEKVLPALRGRFDPMSGSLALAKREMAALILANRHDTIRAKTVNARAFHMDVSDQFYWYVDEHILLGRQMPIALVAMRPERPYVDPVSFWDYATISMAAPTLTRCVLGDSDDFLMLELRKRDTFRHLLRLGEPPIEDVARVLGYMTPDQYEMGRYPLTLHARDLPARVVSEREKLDAYVGAVYSRLPPATDHIGHPYWNGLIDEFRRNRAEWHRRNAPEANPGAATGIAAGERRTGRLQALWTALFGRLPRVTRNHPQWAVLRHALAAIEEGASPERRVLLVRSEGGVLERLFEMHDTARVWRVSPQALRARGLPPGAADLDLCVMDIDWEIASDFSQDLHAIVRPAMRDGGRIVVHCAGKGLDGLRVDAIGAITDLVPRIDFPTLYYAGGRKVAAALDLLAHILQERAVGAKLRVLRALARVPELALRARAANRRAESLDAKSIQVPCRAVTLVIEVRKSDAGG